MLAWSERTGTCSHCRQDSLRTPGFLCGVTLTLAQLQDRKKMTFSNFLHKNISLSGQLNIDWQFS